MIAPRPEPGPPEIPRRPTATPRQVLTGIIVLGLLFAATLAAATVVVWWWRAVIG